MNPQQAPEADGVAQARNLLAVAAQEVDRLEVVAGKAFGQLTVLARMLAQIEKLALAHESEAVEAAVLDAATLCREGEILLGYINTSEWGLCSLRNLVHFLALSSGVLGSGS